MYERIRASVYLAVCLLSTRLWAADVHVPDYSNNHGGYTTSKTEITLTNESSTKPLTTDSLKITANNVTGYVKSPSFTITATAQCGTGGLNLAYWNVAYYLKSNLTSGSYSIRLKVLDGDNPYEICFDNFAGPDSVVNEFTYKHKPLCAIATTHPNSRHIGGNRQVELIIYLDQAVGNLWLSDVNITTANRSGPGFSDTDWNAFETADGKYYVTANIMGFQPSYALTYDYCSDLIMDSAFKLIAVVGFNQIREDVTWGDHYSRQGVDINRAIINNSEPDGSGDYDKDLNRLYDWVTGWRYYGLGSSLIVHGSPDWSHPLHHNNISDGPHNGFANPGNPNGLGDPYSGPQYAKGNHWLYPPDDWQTYRNFVQALATKMRNQVDVYEIINEINVAEQGAVIGGYKAATQWIKHFHEAVRPIDPNVQIIIGASDKMLAALIADGAMDYADGVAYHFYSGNLPETRRIVESYGSKKHIYMNEYHGIFPELMTQTRCQGRWTVFSLFTGSMNDHRLLELRDALGKTVNADQPKGYGDRIALANNVLYDYGVMTGKLQADDYQGTSANRITAEIIHPGQIEYGSTTPVILRATNNSPTTFHNVRIWPIGFVDNLGFDMPTIRAADKNIAEFLPNQTHEVILNVSPTTTKYKAAGTYTIGLGLVNDEGIHSLTLSPLKVLPKGAATLPLRREESAMEPRKPPS